MRGDIIPGARYCCYSFDFKNLTLEVCENLLIFVQFKRELDQ